MKKLLWMLALCPVYALATPVNINQADANKIAESLMGIGAVKAEAIVQYRKEHGDFKTLADLEKVTGIGEKTIKANEKDILFSDESNPETVTEAVKAEEAKTVDAPKAVEGTKSDQ